MIAHSRGTDVAISAFRELVIFARGAGISARERYKIKNFVMAAPDIDVSGVSQRVRRVSATATNSSISRR